MASETTLTVTPSSFSLPKAVSSADFHAALSKAAAAWSFPGIPCTNLSIEVSAPAPRRLATFDGRRLFVFRTRRWCHNEDCGRTRVFPHAAAAMTMKYDDDLGHPLREADVELNAVSLNWTLHDTGTLDGGRRSIELYPVVLHELGHVLGLQDVCGTQHGVEVANDCPEAQLQSVMLSGSQRSRLSAWDVEQVCQLFPRQGVTPTTGEEADGGWVLWVGLSLVLCHALVRWVGRWRRS